MERWLTVSDVARQLDLTPDAIRDLERRGQLRAIRTVGRKPVRLFREADVREFAQRRRSRRPPVVGVRSAAAATTD